MKSRTKRVLHEVGSELRDNPPRQLKKTAKKYGKKRAEKQRKAILLNKARKRGAKIPGGKR